MTKSNAGEHAGPEYLAAASQLLARYCRAVDTKDIDLLLAVFADDADLHLGGLPIQGAAAIEAEYRRAFQTTRQTKHLIANVEVFGGDQGLSALADLYVTGLKDGVVSTAWGTHRDELRRGADGWRIVRKEITLDVPFVKIQSETTRAAR